MKRAPIAAVAVLLLGLTAAAQPPADKPREWTPDLMMKVKMVGPVVVSPDGKLAAYTVRQAVTDGDKSEYLTHVHLANIDGSGSRQLTRGDKSCDSPQWAPDGSALAFLSARSGKRNIWVLRLAGGEAEQLTDVKTGVSSFRYSPRGDAIAFTAVEPLTADEEIRLREKNDAYVVGENVKHVHLYLITADAPKMPRQLSPASRSVAAWGGRGGYDWSPDGRAVVFTHAASPRPDDWASADVSLVNVENGEVKPLLQTAAAEFSPFFSPDGKSIAYVRSDEPPTWAGVGRVHVVPADGGASRPLADTADRFGRYSELLGWTADGKKLVYAEARGTVCVLGALPAAGGDAEELGQADGVLTGIQFTPACNMIGFSLERTASPPEPHFSSLVDFKPRKLGDVNKDLAEVPPGKTEVVRWKSADGKEVEGLLTYPVGYEKGKKYPLLLVVHGGPMGVFTQTFTGSPSPYPVAAFAARGYAVLRPNPRGSSGYGKDFRYANYKDWGGGDFKDVMAGVDHVIGMGVADGEKLGVMGWSYGGFMTSWTITQTKRFKAASVGAGVTNLMSFTGTADIPGFLPDYLGAEPWDDLEVYKDHSAMFRVKGVTTPTLIQHGEKDERVPLSQGQELYNALKRQGSTVKMVVYPRTPHGIEEPKLLRDAMTRNLEWFDEYVRR